MQSNVDVTPILDAHKYVRSIAQTADPIPAGDDRPSAWDGDYVREDDPVLAYDASQPQYLVGVSGPHNAPRWTLYRADGDTLSAVWTGTRSMASVATLRLILDTGEVPTDDDVRAAKQAVTTRRAKRTRRKTEILRDMTEDFDGTYRRLLDAHGNYRWAGEIGRAMTTEIPHEGPSRITVRDWISYCRKQDVSFYQMEKDYRDRHGISRF